MTDKLLLSQGKGSFETLRSRAIAFGSNTIYVDFTTLEAFSGKSKTFEIFSGRIWCSGFGGWESGKHTMSKFEARLYSPYTNLQVEIIPSKSNRYKSHVTQFVILTHRYLDIFDRVTRLIAHAYTEVYQLEDWGKNHDLPF